MQGSELMIIHEIKKNLKEKGFDFDKKKLEAEEREAILQAIDFFYKQFIFVYRAGFVMLLALTGIGSSMILGKVLSWLGFF